MAVNLFELLGTVAIDTSDANKNMDDVTKKVEKSEGKLTKAFGAIAGAVVAAFAVDKIADFGKAVVGMADDAQQAMNDFSAATGESMEEYEDVLKSIYKNNFGESFEDIAAAMATVKQQMGDIGAGDLEELTTNALMLRDTFDFEVNESMRAAKMLMEQFNISGTEAFNLIAQGAQKGLDKNGDLLDSINEYAVHYQQLGLGATEFFASLENGTAAGTFSVDKLGDAMKEFGIRVKDNSDTSRAAFEYLGYDADKLFQVFNEGGEDAAAMTQILIQELTGMPDSVEKTTAGVALFGTMWEDLGVKGIEALGNIEGSISTTKDSLDQINNVKYDSWSSAMQGIKRTLETSIFLPLGEKILPILEEKLPGVLEKIEEKAPQVLAVVETAFSKVSAAVSLVKDGIKKGWEIIQPIVDEAKERFTDFSENIIKPLYETYIANLRANFETLAEIWETVVLPIIEIVIDAFFEIMDSIYENVQPAIEAIIEKFNELSEMVRMAITEYILPVVQSFVAMIQELWEENRDKLNLIGELFGVIFDRISQIVSKFVETAKNTIMPFLEWAKGFIEDNMDRIKEIFQGVIDHISNIVKIFIALFKGDWEGMWTAIKDLAANAFDVICNTFSLAWDAIKGIWESAGVGDFFADIWKSIKEAFGSVSDWFSETFAAAWQKVKDIFCKGGEIFDGITEGIGSFFKNTVNGIIGGINKVIAVPFGAINDALSGIKNIQILGLKPFDWLTTISVPEIPLLEKGGVLERGQVGLLEGNGAEAVVPLDQNEKWIREVAKDMKTATGNDALLQKILDVLLEIRNSLPEEFADIIAGMKFAIGEREFARLVKAVN